MCDTPVIFGRAGVGWAAAIAASKDIEATRVTAERAAKTGLKRIAHLENL
jgi:hypothetical protein